MKNILKHPQIKSIIDHYENGNNSQLAKKLGISNSNMSNIMYRNAKVSYEVADKISKLYPDVSREYILGTSDVMHFKTKSIKKEAIQRKPFKEIKYSEDQITKRFVKALNTYQYLNGGLKDADICRMLKIHSPTLSSFRNGDRQINLKIITLLANKLNLNPNYIILGIGNEFI
jgi:transcriptional regulator with XRE-family HTH domain